MNMIIVSKLSIRHAVRGGQPKKGAATPCTAEMQTEEESFQADDLDAAGNGRDQEWKGFPLTAAREGSL